MSSDSLQGRIYEFCLADLQKDEDQAFRKIKLKCEDISGRNCLTNFFAMDFTGVAAVRREELDLVAGAGGEAAQRLLEVVARALCAPPPPPPPRQQSQQRENRQGQGYARIDMK